MCNVLPIPLTVTHQTMQCINRNTGNTENSSRGHMTPIYTFYFNFIFFKEQHLNELIHH